MASSSSCSSQFKRFHVFSSFHGPDVRRGFLSHLHNHFATKGSLRSMNQKIERGHTIGPELVQAIRESRASIVLLSKNYASSSWCLDELVEILKCKEDQEQTVMTIFYQVDPSDVRKQSGDFGSVFEKTCRGKTEEVKQRWSKALAYVATIAGEHSLNWVNEADMIQKIAMDVSNKLNVTYSSDFDEMVGMEAHLRKMNTLLCLESDEVKMIGIWGPAGVGKTTIGRALFNKLSCNFRLRCFMGNLSGSYKSMIGVDDYDFKLSLQSHLLSKILNQGGMRVHHLGAIKEWLHDQRVLIILDDVDDSEQLEVLAKETSWFGPGSRIIVTTKDKKILKEQGINDIYHVDFPSEEEAIEILCLSAFKQSSPRDGFGELANKVVKFCGNLPLGLRVVGASLHGQREDEWRLQIHGIETNLDRKIEDVLRVGYDKLLEKDQSLFLHIACFFNHCAVDHVITVLADSNMDVQNGLTTLSIKTLVQISADKCVEMHNLLQQFGRQVVVQQSWEPGKRQFLVDDKEIRDILSNETGTESVSGISFDASNMSELSISGRAFERMRNLKYLRFNNPSVSLLGDLVYLPRLRFLRWPCYPGKCLPPTFQPEHLVELQMVFSSLEKLWGGIQPLPNLRKLNLVGSFIKEIPNLSKATNLEELIVANCVRLVELPPSMSNLHKLRKLVASSCDKLQVVPTNINLASLEEVHMNWCKRLTSFPNFSRNIKILRVGGSKIKEFPLSIVGHLPRLKCLEIGSRSLKQLTYIPLNITSLDLSWSKIKAIPDCVIGLPCLMNLNVESCFELVSIKGHSPSLMSLYANDCVSLKAVCCSFHKPIQELMFYNCLNLDEEARRGITQQSSFRCIYLPGNQVPAGFTHNAIGNFITIPLAPGGEGTFSVSSRFKAYFLLSPVSKCRPITVTCHLRSVGGVEIHTTHRRPQSRDMPYLQSRSEHLFIFCDYLFNDEGNRCLEGDITMKEIVFEFTCLEDEDRIMACGVDFLEEEGESGGSMEMGDYESGGEEYEARAFMVSQYINIRNSTYASQSWLRKLRLKMKKME